MSKKTIVMGVALALYIPSHIICMDQPKITIHQYQSECEKTIAQQKTKLEKYKITAIHKNLAEEKVIFQNKLEQCKMFLEGQKKVFLGLIEQQLNVDKTMWQACMKTIEDIKQLNKANQHLPLPNVFHDSNIPAFPLRLITERLKKMGFNPQRINIYGETNINYLYSCQIPMPCLYQLETLCSKKEKKNIAHFIISPENIRPGKIIINLDLLKNLSTVHQGALCIRIIEDIVQNSMLFSHVITTFAPLLTDKPTSIITSEQFKKLHAFYTQKLTAFQPSLSNPTTASCILQLVTDCFHPDFTSQDYKLLAKIDRYWKSLTWLEQQEQNRK